MAVGKEIRTKIKSIQSTQKITSAMQMVAASKMRRAQMQAQAARPYATQIHRVIEHLSKSQAEYQHPYMLESKEIKRVGIIVCSTDRGLCGGLNVNLFRKVLAQMEAFEKQGIEIEIAALGSRAESFFKGVGAKLVASSTQLGETPAVKQIIGPVMTMLKSYSDANIQALYLAHNDFVNTMVQKPTVSTLLPITEIDAFEGEAAQTQANHWDYLYEPDPKELLDFLLDRYIETQVYHGVVENVACEQAARMMAMRSATDNAGELISSLQLSYNKARQAAITQELSEIVSGAAAV